MLAIFGRRSSKEHFYEIILKSVHWSRRRCNLKGFILFSAGSILFNGAERFMQFW